MLRSTGAVCAMSSPWSCGIAGRRPIASRLRWPTARTTISINVAEIDQAVEAATLAEPLRTGSKRNGNALLAAHVRLGTPGAAELRSQIEAGKAHGHLPIVQGFVWRARGMSEADAIARLRLFDRVRTDCRRGAARPHRRGGGASRARRPAADDCRTCQSPVPPDAEIESFMPWVDAAASRQARAHLRLFAS